jgi:hypothetical protein
MQRPVNTAVVRVYKGPAGFDPNGWDLTIGCGAIAQGNENLSLINQQDSCGKGLTLPGEHVPDVYPNSVMTVKINIDGEMYWVTSASFDAYITTCNECCTALPVLANPANLAATPGNAQVALNWDDVTNASNYIVERSTSNSFATVTQVYSGATSAFTDTGRTNGTPYYYRVKAQAAGYQDSGYAFANATPNLPQLAQPATFTGTPGSLQAVLDWADVASATGYSVDMATNSSFTSPTNIYTGAASAYTKTGLTAATTYYFRVKATAAGFLDSPYAYVNVTPTA